MKKQDEHIFLGMQRDVAASKQKGEFLWDAYNVRFTAREDDTMYAVTNERGPQEVQFSNPVIDELGNIIGNISVAANVTLAVEIVSTQLPSPYYILNADDFIEFGKPFTIMLTVERGFFTHDTSVKTIIFQNFVDRINEIPFLDTGNTLEDIAGITIIFGEDAVIDLTADSYIIPGATNIIKGKYLGHCVLGNFLTLFTLERNITNIYRIEYKNNFYLNCIFAGNLNNDAEHPIETLGVYENPSIQKIYWVDGKNQPRVINISKFYSVNEPDTYASTDFDFIPELTLGETVTIQKENTSAGIFPACTLQYAFTYYNKYGQESNIVWTSQMLYTSFPDRAGNPAESIGNAFKINITGLDQKFEYLRIYSIKRTSWNGTLEVKRVKDIEIWRRTGDNKFHLKDCSYTDDNTEGEVVDPNLILYIGGEELIASTLIAKDNTLFLGNVKMNRRGIPQNIKNTLRQDCVLNQDSRVIELPNFKRANTFTYSSTLAAKELDSEILADARSFKYNEVYRFGIQLQHKSGKWSEPIFLKDATITSHPFTNIQRHYDYNYDPYFRLTLPAVYTNIDLTSSEFKDYKKVRGIIVSPSILNRRIIAQGIVCPTVYNKVDRRHNTPHSQSSWYIRPIIPGFEDTDIEANIEAGTFVQFKHNMSLYTEGRRSAEIQGVQSKYSNIPSTTADLPDDIRDVFFVDYNTVTFHSPDIEFDKDITNLDPATLKFRIAGRTEFDGCAWDIDIKTSSPTFYPTGKGFVKKSYSVFDYQEKNAGRTLAAGLFYEDYMVDDSNSEGKYLPWDQETHPLLWMVYPWHRSGSLNNDGIRPANGGNRSAVLKTKRISNIHVSHYNVWSLEINNFLSTSPINFFDSDEMSLTKINVSSGAFNYYGNVDTLINHSESYSTVFASGMFSTADSTPVKSSVDPVFNETYNLFKLFKEKDEETKQVHAKIKAVLPSDLEGNWKSVTGDYNSAIAITKEPVIMKYRSTPHAVFSLEGSASIESGTYGSKKYNTEVTTKPYLWLGEIVRTNADGSLYTPDFGGTDPDALLANEWLPAGEAVTINTKGTTQVKFWWGDTWYQKYDCLKTYNYTTEDENQIVEIASFMVESRINLDGRYDRNRGQVSNINMSPTNFNLMNDVYSQPNNVFTYKILDEDFYKINEFSNSITWSLTKTNGSETDIWTKLNFDNNLDLDGNKGEVTSLQIVNDNLLCFQERGISSIMFNSRVQIPTSDGVPIEISNNMKVDGYKYLNDVIGCTNKWTIVKMADGIYFIDSLSNALYSISSQGLNNISDNKGFGVWFDDNVKQEPWTLNNYTMKSFYDNNHNDLYIVNEDSCLVYSAALGNFTSFMSYENLPAMFNIGSDFFAVKETTDGNLRLYKMFAGQYNNFFDELKPFYITYISNDNPAIDKIFTNVQYRADSYLGNTLQHNSTFNYIRSWNEYQDTGQVPINAKKKFRVWRADIPRDEIHHRDRIRNTWTYITLGRSTNLRGTNMILHDVSTVYYI